MPDPNLDAALARILIDEGMPRRAVGAGFLVSDCHILTCAHVVTEALGLDRTTAEKPTTSIWLDLFLVPGAKPMRAKPYIWHPIKEDAVVGVIEDVAVLTLETPLPSGAHPVPTVVLEGNAVFDREVRLCGFPKGMEDGDYVSGRLQGLTGNGWVQLDPDLGRRTVAPGFSGTPVWDKQENAVAGIIVSIQRRDGVSSAYMIPMAGLIAAWPDLDAVSRPSNPYQSLNAFREADAPYFFGRDSDIQDLVEAVKAHPLVAVVGASGSGKSSLVLAGLLPRLRTQDRWFIAPFRPKSDPFGELATALASLLYPELDKQDRREKRNEIRDKLHNGHLSLTDEVAILTEENPDKRLLLIVDQFEELYTQNLGEERQRQFINALLETITIHHTTCTLLLTLRGDFIGRAVDYGPLAEALDAHAKKILGPLNEDALRAAIEEPAKSLDVTLEPGLTTRILQDVSHEPGSLPLLEFALTQLWERQSSRQLTHKAYEAIGGVKEALARYADQVYTDLKEYQARLRRIFVQLVRPGEGTEDTRQVATREQVGEDNWDLVTKLADHRLVVTGRKEIAGLETVEVVHEALIRHWRPLQHWMGQDRRFRVWQNRLRQALQVWEEKSRDDGALLRGAPLAEAEDRLKTHGNELSSLEREYINTSLALRAREVAEKEDQQRRDLETARRLADEAEARRHSEHQRSLVLIVGLVVALLLAGVAGFFWQQAEKQADIARTQEKIARDAQKDAERDRNIALKAKREAEAQTHIARARHLGTQSQLLHEAEQSELVQRALLAAESLKRLPTLQGFMTWNDIQAIMPPILVEVKHQHEILAIAWSPDGKLFATAAKDGTARVWQAATGKPLLKLDHERWVGAIAFSPDGRLLATTEENGPARLWDVATGTEIARMEQKRGKSFVNFSPDGTRVATLASAGTFKTDLRGVYHLWDTATGKLMVSMEHPGDYGAGQLIFNPDKRRMATAGADKTARIWDAKTGNEVMTLSHPHRVASIDFSPDGQRLATGTAWEGEVRVWDLQTGTETLRIDTSQDKSGVRLFDLKFSPDGKMLAMGGSEAGNHSGAIVWNATTGEEISRMNTVNKTLKLQFSPNGSLLATTSDGVLVSPANVRVWEVTTGREVARVGPEIAATSMALSSDGNRLATAGDDHLARIWALDGQSEHTRLTHSDTVWNVGFSPDGQKIVTIAGHTIRLLELETGKLTDELTHFPWNAGGWVQFAVVSPNSRWIAASYYNGNLVMWDLKTGEKTAIMSHNTTAAHVAFSPDGQLLASASDDHTARIWNAASGQELALLMHDDYVRSVNFSPDGKRLATASADKKVRIWNVETGQNIMELQHEGPVWAAFFTPDGKQIGTLSDDDSKLHFWNAQTGRRGDTLEHKDFIFSAVLSPDGEWIATASRDSTAAIWNLVTGKPIFHLVHQGPVTGVSYSEDGKWLATWSAWEETARIWEAATGHEVARFKHDDTVESAAFSPNGRWLVTGSKDKTARVWTWRSEDIVAEICSRVTRNLTAEEWSRFIGNEPYRSTCSGIDE